jgi:hypothetical protein
MANWNMDTESAMPSCELQVSAEIKRRKDALISQDFFHIFARSRNQILTCAAKDSDVSKLV